VTRMRDWRQPHHAAEPGLEAKVAFLRQPSSYRDPTYRVEALETHMSWVFLLDDYVYKLKKPVCYELLDFRTLAQRHFFCGEEMRLNQRLAPDVYLGLVPLTFHRRRQLALGGGGAVVDWLVRMSRLPDELMLDYAIMHGTLASADLLRLAKRLALFYLSQPAQQVDSQRYCARFRHQLQATGDELSHEVYELCPDKVRGLCAAQLAALQRVGDLLEERVRAGHIVEGHGDLRPEHIYLGEPLAVIDCLEFSRELRIVDAADEIGFLALECERLGSAHVGTALLQGYGLLSGDTPEPALIDFYQSFRAGTRAMIAARHLLDENFRHSPHWLMRANHYLQLAEDHIARCA
jgi:aminoglycoside phosphotransferase family enzyme